MKRWFRSPLLLLAALILFAPGSGANAQVALNGAGATFPAPLYTRWFNEYARLTGVQVNYQAIGSGGGIRAITDRTVDFGGSDAILTDQQQAAIPNVMHIPMTSGSVAMAMNLEGLSNGQLKLDSATIAGIYLGQITNWSAPAIQNLNPDLLLPDAPIVVVRRSDGSGTTFIFTDYLSKVSAAWATQVGSATSVNWPTGIGGQGNAGVAGEVRANPGSVGYIELAYAIQNGIPYASLYNAAGYVVEPSIASTTAAAEGVPLPADAKVSITNSAAPDAYPIVGFTWILASRGQEDQSKGQALADLLWWAIHVGQAYTSDLLYAPLSPSAVAIAEAQIRTMDYQGQPFIRQ